MELGPSAIIRRIYSRDSLSIAGIATSFTLRAGSQRGIQTGDSIRDVDAVRLDYRRYGAAYASGM